MVSGSSRQKSRFRPQNGQAIRGLRERHHLRQAEFADKVNDHLRRQLPGLHTAEMLTQSMVSDLEKGNSSLGVLHLLAISDLFDVPTSELLTGGLVSLGKSEIAFGNVNGLTTACLPARERAGALHSWFCQREPDKQFVVYPTFPSGLFTTEACLNCHLAKGSALEHIEFYPLDALIEFVFSPVSFYSKRDRIRILERIIRYFDSNIYQRIYFMPVHLESSLKDPCLYISQENGQVTFLMSDKKGGVSFVEVNNQALSDTLHKYYHQDVELVQYGVILLEIALATLTTVHPAEPYADILFFQQQCDTRTRYGEWVKSCFSPDIQALFVSH